MQQLRFICGMQRVFGFGRVSAARKVQASVH